MDEQGLLSFGLEGRFYTLYFPQRGWLAVELLHFLDDILRAPQPHIQIVKLLGYLLQVSSEKPSLQGRHWVVVDLGAKLIETNSPLLCRIVDERPIPENQPLPEATSRRIYELLDENDFTVKLYR